ncbi:MAG TPA: alpha/beta hydrolase [Bellilinea sp.]
MAQLFFGSIMREGVRIQYYRTGGEKPPLIMLHGLMDNALSWNRIPLLLEVEYDVVLVDARGHGMSGLDARGAGLDVQADDVTAVIEQLHLVKPVLVGHSMGAALAGLVAARLPKVIRGAVLIDPPWRDEEELIPSNGKERYDETFREGFRKIKETNLEVLMAKGRAENPGWDDSEFSQWARARQQFNLDTLNTVMIRAFPWHEIAPRLTCPGLLITGDPEYGAVITPALGEKITKAWRKGKLVYVPRAGHSIHRDQFVFVMQAISSFLHSLGKWSPRG